MRESGVVINLKASICAFSARVRVNATFARQRIICQEEGVMSVLHHQDEHVSRVVRNGGVQGPRKSKDPIRLMIQSTSDKIREQIHIIATIAPLCG